MSRGRWRLAAGLGLFALAGAIAASGLFSDGGPRLSDDARRYPTEARKLFVGQVRNTDQLRESSPTWTTPSSANPGAAFCTELAKTGSSLKAVFALQLAGRTHPGDVYVTAAARRQLCSGLADADTKP